MLRGGEGPAGAGGLVVALVLACVAVGLGDSDGSADGTPSAVKGVSQASPPLPVDPVVATALTGRLVPPASSGPCTVLQIDRNPVPPATTWFRLRSAVPGTPMPTPIGGALATDGALWFPLTAPKPAGQLPQGVQEFPFMGTGVFNAGNVRDVVPCNITAPRTIEQFIVEAWTDRSDLGDGSHAALLATSTAMTFTFDDLGFSAGLKFDTFAVTPSETVPGLMTVTAQPTNTTAYAYAKLVTWFAFRPTAPPAQAQPRRQPSRSAHHPSSSAASLELQAGGGQGDGQGDASARSGTFPSFTLDTVALGDDYSTRLFSTPSANVSYSSPGVHFIGIYGAWNGQ